MIRYRRRRSTKVLNYDAWNFEIEIGDLLVNPGGILFRAEESSGWGKACAGELYTREIKPPEVGMKAVIIKDEIYWVEDEG